MKTFTIYFALASASLIFAAEPQLRIIATTRPTKSERLRVAAEHLSEAGLEKDAERLRDRARREVEQERDAKQSLLDKKLATLDKLQGEINNLRAEVATTPHVKAKLTLVEISRTKLRDLGFDFPHNDPISPTIFQANAAGNPAPRVSGVRKGDDAGAEQMLSALKRDHIAREIVTTNLDASNNGESRLDYGHQVLVFMGPEGDAEPVEVGYSVRLQPHVSKEGRIQAVVELSEVACDRTRMKCVNDCYGYLPSALKARKLTRSFDVLPGQAIILSGLNSRKQQTEKVMDAKDVREMESGSLSAQQKDRISMVQTREEEVELLLLARLGISKEPSKNHAAASHERPATAAALAR